MNNSVKASGILLIGTLLMASCSTDNDALLEVALSINEAKEQMEKRLQSLERSIGCYWGDWKIDGNKVDDTDLYVRNDSLMFQLPEISIIMKTITWSDLKNVLDDPWVEDSLISFSLTQTEQHAKYDLQGISSSSTYSVVQNKNETLSDYGLFSPVDNNFSYSKEKVNPPRVNYFSFGVMVNDYRNSNANSHNTIIPLRIYVGDKNGNTCRVMYDFNTRQWTLILSINEVYVRNLLTEKEYVFEIEQGDKSGMHYIFTTTEKEEE